MLSKGARTRFACTRNAKRRAAATRPDPTSSASAGTAAPRKASFAPVVDARTRLLVLGSLPGERSLIAREYYAHPQNQFWRLMSMVVGDDLASLDYGARLSNLLEARVGLWDVVASAERSGSLDCNIIAAEPNDLPGLITRLPALEAVAFNGIKAAAIGRRAFIARGGLRLIDLPSSSPAFTKPFAEKLAAWSALSLFVGGG